LPTNIRLGLNFERLARDNHSSLLQKSVNYNCKNFYCAGPGIASLKNEKISELAFHKGK
jgi:hypothetical protein